MEVHIELLLCRVDTVSEFNRLGYRWNLRQKSRLVLFLSGVQSINGNISIKVVEQAGVLDPVTDTLMRRIPLNFKFISVLVVSYFDIEVEVCLVWIGSVGCLVRKICLDVNLRIFSLY